MSREVMKQALEALKGYRRETNEKVIAALEAELDHIPDAGKMVAQRQPLTGDEIDKLMTDAARYRKLVAMEAALVEPVTIWHYLRNPDDLDTAHDIKEKS